MKRRNFVKNSTLSAFGLIITKDLFSNSKAPVYGHNEMTYTMNAKWGALNPGKTPVNDCHEMVQDAKGRILLLTNETKNNVIIYNKSGSYIESWGTQFPGAHGLTIHKTGRRTFYLLQIQQNTRCIKPPSTGKFC
jgi:peptidylamidoglycolate lyase